MIRLATQIALGCVILGLLANCGNAPVASPQIPPTTKPNPTQLPATVIPTSMLDQPVRATQTADARSTSIANAILNTTASAIAHVTNLALTPTRTPPPPTPTLDYSTFVDAWSVYQNAALGFTFEYPTIYRHWLYSSRGCLIGGQSSGIRVEGLGQTDSGLEQVGLDWIGGDFAPELTDAGYERGIEYADFSFAYTWIRSGLMRLYRHNGEVIALSYVLSVACDVPEIGLNEIDAYSHILSTFEFLD